MAEDVLETIQDDLKGELSWTEDEEQDKEGEVGSREGEGEGRREMVRRQESYRKSHSVESRGQHEGVHAELLAYTCIHV